MSDYIRIPQHGVLIALEGIDGSGTTTQARLLVERLRRQQVPVHLTRQPSDGPIGLEIRRAIVSRDDRFDRTTLALLFAADRVDHCRREVRPALARGAVVVSDRWYHSSFAYQTESQGDVGWIAAINRSAEVPDLTIFLAVEPEVAAARRAAAGRAAEMFDDPAVQRRVVAGYRRAIDALAGDRGERIERLDGDRAPGVVHDLVYQVTARLLASLSRG